MSTVRYLVDDVDTSLAFYRAIGFRLADRQVLVDDPSGNPVELFEAKPPADPRVNLSPVSGTGAAPFDGRLSCLLTTTPECLMSSCLRSLRALTCLVAGVSTAGLAGATVIDGPVSYLVARGEEQLQVVKGARISYLDTFDRSHADVLDGTISWLTLHDASSANVSGGVISWIQAYDNSVVRLSGIGDLSWLVFGGVNARAEVVANDVGYSAGHLSGRWADGRYFSFWAVNDSMAATMQMPANITIIAAPVPAPAALVMFALGLPFVLRATRRRPRPV